MIAREQLGRRRRRAGVGLVEARQVVAVDAVLEDARPHRGDAVEPRRAVARGRVAAASRRRGCARSAPGAGPATRPARSSSRPCGTAGTCTPCRAPPGVARRADVRAQPVRPVRQHDALRPAGAPAREEDDVRVALVEVGVDGPASSAPVGISGDERHVDAAPRARPRPRRATGPHRSSRGRAYSATGVDLVDAMPARSAARTPRRSSPAPRTPGPPRATVSPHHSTRSPRPTPVPRAARSRCGSPRRSISPKVSASSSSVAATRVGRDPGRVGEHLARRGASARAIARPAVAARLACRQRLLLVCPCHEDAATSSPRSSGSRACGSRRSAR